MRQTAIIGLFVLMLCCVPAYGQETNEAARVRTRELLSQLLTKAGPGVGVDFRQSQKQPFNFVGSLSKGLTYADSLEIVISVTSSDTIGFRVYPHYKNGYINIDKVRNTPSLMRQLLRLSDRAFLFWEQMKPATSSPVTRSRWSPDFRKKRFELCCGVL